MASTFLINDILRKECEASPTGNMLYDFFNFLKLFEGRTRRLDADQIKRNAGRKTRPTLYLQFNCYEHSPK